MKYKVGDVVKVRSDLDVNKLYNGFYITTNMIEFKGKLVRIARVFNDRYNIYEDLNKWSWNDEMLEPVTEEDIKKHFEEYVKGFKDYEIKVEVKKKERILDEEEKKYLSAIIRPFRDRVEYISKGDCIDKTSYITIAIKHIDININENIRLPYFETNKMYKGMEDQKRYTLEELGI